MVVVGAIATCTHIKNHISGNPAVISVDRACSTCSCCSRGAPHFRRTGHCNHTHACNNTMYDHPDTSKRAMHQTRTHVARMRAPTPGSHALTTHATSRNTPGASLAGSRPPRFTALWVWRHRPPGAWPSRSALMHPREDATPGLAAAPQCSRCSSSINLTSSSRGSRCGSGILLTIVSMSSLGRSSSCSTRSPSMQHFAGTTSPRESAALRARHPECRSPPIPCTNAHHPLSHADPQTHTDGHTGTDSHPPATLAAGVSAFIPVAAARAVRHPVGETSEVERLTVRDQEPHHQPQRWVVQPNTHWKRCMWQGRRWGPRGGRGGP